MTASVTAAEQQPDESSASNIQMLAEPQGQSLGRQGSQEDLAASEQGVDDAAELQRLLREEKRKTAALISEQLCCSCACDVACPCNLMSAFDAHEPQRIENTFQCPSLPSSVAIAYTMSVHKYSQAVQ